MRTFRHERSCPRMAPRTNRRSLLLFWYAFRPLLTPRCWLRLGRAFGRGSGSRSVRRQHGTGSSVHLQPDPRTLRIEHTKSGGAIELNFAKRLGARSLTRSAVLPPREPLPHPKAVSTAAGAERSRSEREHSRNPTRLGNATDRSGVSPHRGASALFGASRHARSSRAREQLRVSAIGSGSRQRCLRHSRSWRASGPAREHA